MRKKSHWILCVLGVLLIAGAVMAVSTSGELRAQEQDVYKAWQGEHPEKEETPEKKTTPKPVQKTTWTQAKLKKKYGWLSFNASLPKLKALRDHIGVPTGYVREKVSAGSFGEYLRFVPVRQDRKNTLLYNGRSVYMPSAGIVPLDLGKKDLHQCADSVLRLHGEYLWANKKASKAQYHYTSGDLAAWRNWRKGRVLRIKGRKVVTKKVQPVANTHKAYRRYLDRVFMYASTRSMHRDAKVIKKLSSIQAGDFFLTPGSPGHVVIVMDIAKNQKGQRVALIGQGYIPAREFHIVKGDKNATVDGLWYKLPTKHGQLLVTPTWTPFKTSELKRFKIL